MSVVAVQGKGEKRKDNDDFEPEVTILEDGEDH
jgi:hypothetical protein